MTGFVYKVKCKSCSFVYIGESIRSWNYWGDGGGGGGGAEHKPSTKGNNESAIQQHTEMTGHDIHPNYVELLVDGVNNQQQRLFLESLHSTLNTDAANEC